MNIVLSRESGVPIRTQLALQIEVAVVTGQLLPGRKLPSVRELARRLKLHHNTVAAAYGDLAARGLIESKRGSGIYVSRHGRVDAPEEAREIDELIASFLEMASAQGHSAAAIREAVERWLRRQPPDHVLLVEPAPDVRAVIAHELAHSLPCRVEAVGLDALADPSRLEAALVVTSFYHDGDVRARVGPAVPLVTISLNPGSAELDRLRKLPAGSMLGIVSVSPILLATVGTVVASVRGEDILVRPVPLADEQSWRRLGRTADVIVCDSVSYDRVARHTTRPLKVIRLVPDETVAQLREYFPEPAPGGRRGGGPDENS
jgi:GntR family transcriptional regulator